MRRMENGSASTTLSAVTLFVPDACANESVYVPERVALHRDELGARRDLACEAGGESIGDLVVAADDVVLLVRGAEDAELALTRVAEQVEQVERALLGRFGAVLDVVRDVEQLPDPRFHPVLEGLLDPVDDRHVVELAASLGRDLERGRVARGGDVAVDLLPRVLDVVGHLRVGVRRPVEVAEHLRSVLLGPEEVVQLQAETGCELPDRGVALVDQLAAVLDDLALGERAPESPAAPADPVGRLVDLGVVAGIAQRVRGTQPGEAGTDDDDLRCALRPWPEWRTGRAR